MQNMNDLPAALGDCRVRKPSQPTSQFGRVRPQSYDASFFADLDMSKINVVNNSSTFSQGLALNENVDIFANGTQRHPTLLPYTTAPEQAAASSMYAPSMAQQAPPYVGYDGIQSFANNHFGPEVSTLSLNASKANGTMPHHSLNMQPKEVAQPTLAQYPVGHDLNNSSLVCSNGIPHLRPSDCSEANGTHVHATNGVVGQSLQPSGDLFAYSNPNTAALPYNSTAHQQPNVPTPQPGTLLHPLQLQQWQQQFGDPPKNIQIETEHSPQPNSDIFFSPFGTVGGDCMGGTCCCGPNCQCLMCATHPYNQTMMQHIQMLYEPADEIQQSIGVLSEESTQPDVKPEIVNEMESCCSKKSRKDTSSIPSLADGDSVPPSVSPDPSNVTTPETGSVGEHQQLNPDDFVFINYELEGLDGCAGEQVSCLCGDGCACPGCSLHNVPESTDDAKNDTLVGFDTAGSFENATNGASEEIKQEISPEKKSCCGGG